MLVIIIPVSCNFSVMSATVKLRFQLDSILEYTDKIYSFVMWCSTTLATGTFRMKWGAYSNRVLLRTIHLLCVFNHDINRNLSLKVSNIFEQNHNENYIFVMCSWNSSPRASWCFKVNNILKENHNNNDSSAVWASIMSSSANACLKMNRAPEYPCC